MIDSRRPSTRRGVLAAVPAVALVSAAPSQPGLELVTAPSNLGLRHLSPGHEPGAWRAPEALQAAGLARAVGATRITQLQRPGYRFVEEHGTRIGNGHAIRKFSEELARKVAGALRRGDFPLVVGGDCSILLGCLLDSRASGEIGSLHVDGHSDFYHPGNYPSERRLGGVAGMDLALATGRGEPLLALWGGKPLVEDQFVVRIGERENLQAGIDHGDIVRTEVRRLPVRQLLQRGMAEGVRDALAPVAGERRMLWLHIDLEVLDQKVMPAVDSPGFPGLTFAQPAELIGRLLASGRVVGADVAIFDPELDVRGTYAKAIVACLARGFGRLGR